MIDCHVSHKEEVLSILQRVVPNDGASQVPLHEPVFGVTELEFLQDCIHSGWVSSVGPYVERFEADICEYTGASYAVAVVNGTSALHIAYLVAGVQPGDEVLMPALTFVATANAASYCGAIPHYVDSSLDDFGVCPDKLSEYLSKSVYIKDGVCISKKSGRVIRGLCVTHVFGMPAKLQQLQKICDQYRLKLIEDAAEALGSFYHGQHVGLHSFCGVLSFNGNKIMTTGGGGVLLTNNRSVALKAKSLSTTAKKHGKPWEYDYEEIGYNYRMPNINAALGCAQLKSLGSVLVKKRELSKRYRIASDGMAGINFQAESQEVKSNYWLNALVCPFATLQERDEALKHVNSKGYSCRPIWKLLSDLSMYRNCQSMDLSGAKKLECRVINLPSSANLVGYDNAKNSNSHE